MVHIPTKSLLGFTCLCLPVLARALSSAPKENELVCSKTDPKDCYPRIFEPTKDFQNIREGQDIPPGLHVRLNIYTGVREARLNIPMEGEKEGETEATIQEAFTEQAGHEVAVVEQAEEVEPEVPATEETVTSSQIPLKEPPIYDSAGYIAHPTPGEIDINSFQQSLLSIQMETRNLDAALDSLLDLSHDIYYGVEITSSHPVLERLVCFTLGLSTPHTSATENQRDHKSATILASALQNNPTALQEAGDAHTLVTNPVCNDPSTGRTDFISHLRARLGKERDPATLKSKISAISALLREPRIRKNFLSNGVMELLLAIFLKKGERWDGVKRKVGELVMDNFLDADAGAEKGVWPLQRERSSEGVCAKKGSMLGDGCWEWHLEGFAGEGKREGKEWVGVLVDAIGVGRKEIVPVEGIDRGL